MRVATRHGQGQRFRRRRLPGVVLSKNCDSDSNMTWRLLTASSIRYETKLWNLHS